MLWEYIKAIIYGTLEGITEWLPVSSTGHLILLGDVLRLESVSSLGEEYTAMFDVVIQLFAVLAVAVSYRRTLFDLGKSRKGTLSLWSRLILATIPAALIGIAADRLCEGLFGRGLDALLFDRYVVASALTVYGIFFIAAEVLLKKSTPLKEISPASAFSIGCFQALAMIPGTSRSGATILGARVLGIERSEAARFSFLAAIPVICAASTLKLYDFAKFTRENTVTVSADAILLLLTAGLVAFAVSMLTLRFLTDFVKKHSFIPFGIYRIALGLAVFIF